MSKLQALNKLSCVSAYLSRTFASTASRPLDSFVGGVEEHPFRLACQTFVKLWDTGLLDFAALPHTGTKYAVLTLSSGEISLRIVGTRDVQVAVRYGKDATTKSLARAQRAALTELVDSDGNSKRTDGGAQ